MEKLKSLSMTGRLCYLFMCVEGYLTALYPDRDWSPVAERCWQWTGVYWNEGSDIYAQVVPEFLFEFDDYEQTNEREFDGMLSRDDYTELVSLFRGLDVKPDSELNCVLRLPLDFNNECEGTNANAADKPTLEILKKMRHILTSHGIACPSTEKLSQMTADQNAWGDFIDSRYLSVILA